MFHRTNYQNVGGSRMNSNDRYSVMYNTNMSLTVADSEVIDISSSDIVSIAFIHNYDTMTFPIIRVRLYCDISIIQKMTSHPNDIYVRCNMDGGIYKFTEDKTSPILVKPVKNIPFQLKAYIENKNIATSEFDRFDHGELKESDLNKNIKVPIEIYCYNNRLVHMMKQKTQSVYKEMSIQYVVESILRESSISDVHIDPFHNQNKYDQILIPNLNVSNSFAFFDTWYGIYEKGAQIYGDIDKLYVCNTDVSSNEKPIPIYINNAKSNATESGIRKINNMYFMQTLAANVSVVSETDIEKTLNPKTIHSVNLNNSQSISSELSNLYAEGGDVSEVIESPVILHKTMNPYITKSRVARIDERLTRVDIAGIGFDVGCMKINTHYNLIFDSPIRGMRMNKYYRASYICHVFSNFDSNLFIAQTTMNLCSN